MDYVDVLQIHRYDHDTPREETMKALHGIISQELAELINRFGADGQGPVYWRIVHVRLPVSRNATRR
jgi:aryl-alcohol dehydrogenase-like predicted oxidoreductase